ncbi:MAG: helix-turn-helix domain-containing protein [Albidovulum sp.]
MEDPAKGDLRIPALASRAGMSERSFIRYVQRRLGTSPAQFMEMARINRARSLLERSDMPLERVAEGAGYGSSDALFRSFQRHVGVTPGAYRARFSLCR